MRFIIVASIVLLAHAVSPPGAVAQERSRGTARTDKTVDVVRGTRLTLESQAGAVTIHGWDKDTVRVQAQHAATTHVLIRSNRSKLSVQSESSAGSPGSIEYEINVPRWMPVAVEVTFDNITIEGTEGDVSAETVRGHISIKGGSGTVRAESVAGPVVVEGAKGRVTVSSVNDLIRIDDVVGDVSADTTNGAITLAHVQSSMVDASTVNGSVTYEGTVADDGHYWLVTHNGDIVVSIPAAANVTFDVRTYNGRFSSDLAVKGSPPARRGGHGLYTLGTGAAQMGLESFGGSISVRDAASPPPGKRKDER